MNRKSTHNYSLGFNQAFRIVLFTVAVLTITGNLAISQDLSIKGQLSSWMNLKPEKEIEGMAGIRYIPGLNLGKDFSAHSIDLELSANIYGSARYYNPGDSLSWSSKIKPYRLWARYSNTQFELRLGLQKINFGSASMLRSLMWFDKMDPRDPLQLTDGVYGLLLRYYFLNNANIWFWTLYGNKDPKGWELFGSKPDSPEIGGRVQLPAGSGEIGLSVHHRQLSLKENPIGLSLATKEFIPENRLALDGKWDLGIGLWFESTVIHQNFDLSPLKYTQLTSIGADYTLGIGNGLHLMTEFFTYQKSKKLFNSDQTLSFSALSASYPLGLIHNIQTIIYYNWESKDWYRFIQWQVSLDNWAFYLMAYWNPEKFQIYNNLNQDNLFSGKGIQIMAVYNH